MTQWKANMYRGATRHQADVQYKKLFYSIIMVSYGNKTLQRDKDKYLNYMPDETRQSIHGPRDKFLNEKLTRKSLIRS